jgi:hypothetical protein
VYEVEQKMQNIIPTSSKNIAIPKLDKPLAGDLSAYLFVDFDRV